MASSSAPLFQWQHPAQDELGALLSNHVADAAFPCVGAKAALAKGTLEILACTRIDSAWDDMRIHDRLLTWAHAYRADPSLYRSFAVVFDEVGLLSERAFEAAVWQRVQSISDKDVWRGQPYDDRVSSNPPISR